MKRTLALLLTLLLFLSSFTFTFAEDLIDTDFTFTEEAPVEEALPDEEPAPEAEEPQAKASKDDFKWDGSTITDYKGKGGKVVIPKDWGVTAIGEEAFDWDSTITSISIPGTVKTIGKEAFADCVALTSITIESGVTEIGDGAFDGCTKLKTVKLPDSVVDMGEGMFDGCKALKSATLPKGLTELPKETFNRCDALTSVKLPTALQKIGKNAFSQCKSLKSITIPSGVTEIENDAFSYCTALSTVKLPAGLQTLGRFVFTSTAIKSITLPASLTEVSYGAFANCEKLTTVVIPEGVTKIDTFGFNGCGALKSVTLPGSLTEFGETLFDDTMKDCAFNVYVGSAGDNYARENGFKRVYCKNYTMRFDAPAPQNLLLGSEYDVGATAVPYDYGYATYTWKGSSAKVAEVTPDGHITPIREGSLTVTCTMEIKDPNTAKAFVKKTINSKHKVIDPLKLTGVEIFSFYPSNPYVVGMGETFAFVRIIAPSAASPVDVTWKSSSAKIATVDNNGKVTALAKGSATITVTATQGKIKKSASAKVKVVAPDELYGATIFASQTVKVGSVGSLIVHEQPYGIEADYYQWTLSNPALASLDRSTGNVVILSGLKKGTVTATCTVSKNGVSKKASAKVKIVE